MRLLGSVLAGWAGLGLGAVESRSTMPATWSGNCGEALDVQAAEGMTGQHVWPRDLGTFEQRVQVRGNVGTVLRAVGCVAPATAGAVIHADSGVAGHGRRNPREVGGGGAATRF